MLPIASSRSSTSTSTTSTATSATTPATSTASLSDDELTGLALAAAPDVAVDDDAVCLADLLDSRASRSLPEWYMPAPMGPARPLRGWRRGVVLLVVASFLVITAAGTPPCGRSSSWRPRA